MGRGSSKAGGSRSSREGKDMENKEMGIKEMKFKKRIMHAYGIDGEEQHNKNLEIMINCYVEENGKITDSSLDIDAFAEYAGDEKNLKKFIKKGAKIL